MSDQNAPYPDQHTAPEANPSGAPRFVDQAMSQEQTATQPPSNAQHGLGPFTLREWIVMGLATALLVLSFFAAVTVNSVGMHASVWSFGLTWLGAALFPFAAGALIAVRRFAPRVQFMGALSVDQIASVAFCVAAFLWLNLAIILGQLSSAVGDMVGFFGGGATRPVSVGPIVWIAFVVSLAGIFFTIVARFVPPFAEDFADREETPAHATARPARPIVAAPKPAPVAHPGAPYPYPHPAAGEQGAAPQQTGYGQAPYGAPAQQDPYADPSQQGPYGVPAQQNPYADPSQQNPYAAPEQQAPLAAPAPQDAFTAPGQPTPSAADEHQAPYTGLEQQSADAVPEQHAAPYAAPDQQSAEPDSEQQPADAALEQQAPNAVPEQQAADTASVGYEPAESPAQDLPGETAAASAAQQNADDERTPQPDEQGIDPATTALPVTEQPDDATQVFAAVADPSPQEAPSAQPFWALAPEQREVHDFEGRPIYSIGPTAWALVLEDRGSYFVMRHDDGRIGYLHDTTNITRG